MKIITEYITVSTRGHSDIIDLTEAAQEKLTASGLRAGTVAFFASGATAGITTIEYEPGLLKDVPEMFEKSLRSTTGIITTIPGMTAMARRMCALPCKGRPWSSRLRTVECCSASGSRSYSSILTLERESVKLSCRSWANSASGHDSR